MKKLKNTIYAITLVVFLKTTNVFSAFGEEKINPNLKWDNNMLDVTIQNWITYLLWFLFLAATVYWIYGWFLIFTAQDDDDKVKKWRTVIIQSLIWVVLIFAAAPIVEFFIWTDIWIFQISGK